MPMADASADVVYADQVLEHMRGIDDARQFTAEALRSLKPGGIFFVVVPDYLKERQFFWDVDYTHNFVTTERRMRQLFNDGGFEILHMERAIGLATGVKRDLPRGRSGLHQHSRRRRAVALHGHRRSRLQDPQEPFRNADLRRAKAGVMLLRLAITAVILAILAMGIDMARVGARDRGDRSSLSRARARPGRDRSHGDDPAMGAAAARRAASRSRTRDAARLFLVSSFVGSFLPAGVGADAARAYGLARDAARAGSEALASVAVDRILGVFSIVVMSMVGVLAWAPAREDWRIAAAILALTIACSAVFWAERSGCAGRSPTRTTITSIARRAAAAERRGRPLSRPQRRARPRDGVVDRRAAAAHHAGLLSGARAWA